MVFPGIDMLQKRLVEQGKHEGNKTACVLAVFVSKISEVAFPVRKFYFLFPDRF